MRKEDFIEDLSKNDPFRIDWEKVLGCMDDENCQDYAFEECFSLETDPSIKAANINICARVEKIDNKVGNRIVFRKGGRWVSSIRCVHTAVCNLPLGEAIEVLEEGKAQEFVKSLEGKPEEVEIPPWEHFKALRSYVAGIAEMGISNIIQASYEEGDPGQLPFGFNAMMQKQVMFAIKKAGARQASNQIITDFVLHSAEQTNGKDWFNREFHRLERIYDIVGASCSSVEAFQAMSDIFSQNLAMECAQREDTDPTLLSQLATHPNIMTRMAVAFRPDMPQEYLLRIEEDLANLKGSVLKQELTKKVNLLKKIHKLAETYPEDGTYSLDRWNGEGFPKIISAKLCDLPYTFKKRNRFLMERYGFEIDEDELYYGSDLRSYCGDLIEDEDDCIEVDVKTTKYGISPVGFDAKSVRRLIIEADELRY